jgi:hypothetical protein
MKLAAALLVFALLCLPGQDPPPLPRPPEGAQPLPQVPDVPMSAIERKDLWQRFATPSPIAGFYRLRGATRGGRPQLGGIEGYLFVGQRHLSLHLHDHTAHPGKPALQASVREYTLAGSRLQMTCRLGARIPPGDDPILEGDGLVEVRDILITATTLRVLQGEGDWLDFERIE